jgi:uncharacterized protein
MKPAVTKRRESPFVVRLRDLPPEGMQWSLALTDEWTDKVVGGTPLEWHAQGARAQVSLHKTDRDVVAVGQLSGGLTAACSRCTGPSRMPLAASFELVFVPAGDPRALAKSQADDDGEAVADEGGADTAEYVDEQLDLEDTLREQLLLALPYAPLCKPDCKGLCAQCGKDLNEGSCGCTQDNTGPRDMRWAALKDVKL